MSPEIVAPSAVQRREAMDAITAVFEQASASATVTRQQYAIAGHSVEAVFAGRLAERLMPGLQHLEVAAMGDAELTIRAFDSDSTGTRPPLTDAELQALIPAGMPAARIEAGIHAVYGRADSGLSLLTAEGGQALYWVPSARKVPYWERSAPFRSIFSSWMGLRGNRFVHAAAVGLGGSAVLLVGRGGSGKSTAALTCFAAGMDFAGDDYCLVNVAALSVFGLYRSAKLHAENAARVPWLAGAALNEGDVNEKLVYFPAPSGGGSIRSSMRIAAIVLPRVADVSPPRLTRTSAAAALAAIAPTTLLQLTGTDGSAMRDFALLAKSVPAYSLELGGSMDQVPELMRGLLER